jgi:YHS domain-containing protein
MGLFIAFTSVKNVALAGLLGFMALFANAEIYTPWHNNVAVSGYDAVSYFTEHHAVKGRAEFMAEYQQAQWHFSSQSHLDLFIESPEKYAPQFGGHCANGLSDGHKVAADPENWRIIDDKLYLFYSKWGREQWASNVPAQIKLASDYWQTVKK